MRYLFLNHACLGLVVFALFISSCADKDPVGVPLSEFRLLAPQNESIGVAESPHFRWNPAAPEAVAYTLNVWKDEAMTELEVSIFDLTDTAYIADFQLAHGGTYYWSVVATNAIGETISATQAFKFTISFATPSPSPDIAVYFVHPNGIDQPWAGSQSLPFKTVAYASRMVPAGEGDVIKLSAGIFVEQEPILLGLKTNLEGEGAQQTILRSSGVRLLPETNPNSSNYKLQFDGSLIQLVSERLIPGQGAVPPANGSQKLSGFTIDGMDKALKAGIWVENRDQVEIADLIIKDCDYRGVVVSTGNASGTKSYFLKGIKVHDCVFENSGKDLENETLGNLCLSSLDGAEIYNISINDQEGYGIKFIIRGYFTNCKFYNIETQLNENDEKWGEKISMELWNLGPGNEIFNVNANTWLSMVNDADVYASPGAKPNLHMYDVWVLDEDGVSDDRGVELAVPHAELHNIFIEDKGIGIAIWDMGRENLTIRNSIIKNTSPKDNWAQGPAIYIDNSRSWDFEDIFIYNNVFDVNKYGIIVKGEVLNVELKNNVFIDSEKAALLNQSQHAVVWHNNFNAHHSDASWKLEGLADQQANRSGDPLLSKQGEWWSTYYLPLAGSPLIDGGIEVGLPYIGSAPDIGYAEAE